MGGRRRPAGSGALVPKGLAAALAEVSKAATGSPSVEQLHRVNRELFNLPESARQQPVLASSVYSAVQKVRGAFAEGRLGQCGGARQGQTRGAAGEYLVLLGMALRQAALPPRQAEEVLAWICEAAASDSPKSHGVEALHAERRGLLEAIAGYRELEAAVTLLMDPGCATGAVTTAAMAPMRATHGAEDPEKAAAERGPATREAKQRKRKKRGEGQSRPAKPVAPAAAPAAATVCGTGGGADEKGREKESSTAGRLQRLAAKLLSPAVQVQAAEEAEAVPARLSAEEVAAVFEEYVPEVRKLVYREQHGNYSLKFIQSAYANGLQAFQGSAIHQHLTALMRLIVHYGHEKKPGAAKHLREVAEAFTDCQAVQGRVIERVGLRIRGVASDFRGHLVRLVGEYKAMAVKMLALEICTKLGGPDDFLDPAHYENRLLADLGDSVGLNRDHIRQAELDEHAEDRFAPLSEDDCQTATARLAELFDAEALLKALAAEARSFGAETGQDSLSRTFLDWASECMTQKHVVLDEETCTRVEMNDALALAVLETVFLGRPGCSASETYRGQRLLELFLPVAEPGAAAPPEGSSAAAAAQEPATEASRPQRIARLKRRLLSAAVQVPEPEETAEVPARLDAEAVAQVFAEHVPGVQELIYRQQPGNYSMKFIQSAYSDGLRAFSGSDMHRHLMWLMRLIVHHGHEKKPGCARYLREVAEAFTDCQAVQGRTIERVGLQIRGVALDFRGHMVRLAGEYKAMAVKMLALEECTKLGGPDDYNDPAHYENRLIADLGEHAGLNRSHIQQANVDEHAAARFPRLNKPKRRAAAARLRELFDVEALLKAFAAEASTFGVESERESLPRLFLDWASESMTQKHVVLDEGTCTKVEVGDELALAVVEAVFLGKPGCSAGETYRGEQLLELFVPDGELAAEVAKAEVQAAAEEEAESKEEEEMMAKGCGKKGKGKGKPFGKVGRQGLFMPATAQDESESSCSEGSESKGNQAEDVGPGWEIDLDTHWAPIDAPTAQAVAEAEIEGRKQVEIFSRGFLYIIDLEDMVQINIQTDKRRAIRRRPSNQTPTTNNPEEEG